MMDYYKIIDENNNIIQIGYGPIGDYNYIIITDEEYNNIKADMIMNFTLSSSYDEDNNLILE